MVVSMAAVFFASALGATLFVDDAYADTSIEITDSTGETITLDAPARNVITIGRGFTTTVAELGGKEKIVAYDSYSVGVATEYGITGENIGSPYQAAEDLVTKIISLRGGGIFDVEKDIVITDTSTYMLNDGKVRDLLTGQGFKVVSFGGDTYEDILGAVESIAKLIGKESSDVIVDMNEALDSAKEMAGSIAEEDRVTAIYVSESSGLLRVYNEGIAVSMIELAGGINVGYKSGVSTKYHVEEAADIVLLNPDIVLLDGNHSLTAEEFRDTVLEAPFINVVKLDKEWNNYCPAAAEGLRAISALMSDTYEHDDSYWDVNPIDYTVVGGIIAAILIIAVAGIFIMRRH